MHIDAEQRSDAEVMAVLQPFQKSRHSSTGTGSDKLPPMRLPICSGSCGRVEHEYRWV